MMPEFPLGQSFQPGVSDGRRIVLTSVNTLRTVSICHRLFGANLSAPSVICVVMPSLNSLSATSRKDNSSRVMTRTLPSFTRAYDSSRARRRIEISPSRKQSRMVFRCL